MSQINYPQVRKIKDFLRREKMKMSPFYVEGDSKLVKKQESQGQIFSITQHDVGQLRETTRISVAKQYIPRKIHRFTFSVRF